MYVNKNTNGPPHGINQKWLLKTQTNIGRFFCWLLMTTQFQDSQWKFNEPMMGSQSFDGDVCYETD